jgi:thiamine pyrophosphokinase
MSINQQPAPSPMKGAFFMKSGRAVIFANGELPNPAAARAILRSDDTLVAADGGLHHLQKLGLYPSVLIGDLDSVSTADLQPLAERGVSILRYPPEKVETDLELALEWTAVQGFGAVVIAGALGGRLDQTLGNIFLLTWPRLAGIDLRLDDGLQEVFVIWSQADLYGFPGDILSLLPLFGPAKGIVTHGLRYPLRGETLFPERTRGISNELLSTRASIALEEGCLLCIHSRKEAAAAANVIVIQKEEGF